MEVRDKPRTLIIGLDGATFDLIKPWAATGHLPTFARLLEQGVHGPLRAWPNMNSASAWTSIVTGYNPGQHGVFDFGDAPSPQGQRWHPITASDRRKNPFWCILSAAGQRVGVINVPISYPADPVNGFMLSGMDAPSVHSPGFAHPPGLYEELRRAGIDYIIDIPNLGNLSQQNPYLMPELVQQAVDARACTLFYLMDHYPWDAVMVVFTCTDRMQHFYWPNTPLSDQDPSWTPLRALYQRLDDYLAQLLQRAGEESTVLLVSDHGFGPRRATSRPLNPLFTRLGLLQHRQDGGRWQDRLLKNLLYYGRRLIPLPLQRPLAQALPELRQRALREHWHSGVDWSKTQVFADRHSKIYINLHGRQPEGIVPPEAYDPLRERVREILLSLTEPTSGYRIIRGVHRREDIYHGSFVEQAPDLVIEWDEGATEKAICYRVNGESIVIEPPQRDSGDRLLKGTHRSEGIFMAYGPDIKRDATVTNVTHYDITPTILYLQGQPIPANMDGRVLTEIFSESYRQRHPVQTTQPAVDETRQTTAELGDEEAKIIKKRLQDLGYIE